MSNCLNCLVAAAGGVVVVMATNWTRVDVTVSVTTASTPPEVVGDWWRSALILAVFVFIIVGTVIGNSLVCAAVAIVRCLRTPSNLLIVSLAVSDLLVACLVMGLAAFYEVHFILSSDQLRAASLIGRNAVT